MEREYWEYLEYWSCVSAPEWSCPKEGLGKAFCLLDWGQKTSKPAVNNPLVLPGFINSGGLGKGSKRGGIPEQDKELGGNWECFYVGMAPGGEIT